MGDDFHLRNGSRQVEFLLSNGISFGRHNVIVVSAIEGKAMNDVKVGGCIQMETELEQGY